MTENNNTQTDSCPFCNPLIRDCVFLESGNFKAVYNIAPILPGHSLVIPVNHITSFMELDTQQLAEFMVVTKKTLNILLKAFHTDAFDLSVQEKPEAGQTIEHLHLHIVPRIKDDIAKPGNWYPIIHKNDTMIIDSNSRARLSDTDLMKVVDLLRKITAESEMQEKIREIKIE